MSEALIIKNFGPIVNMTFELRVMNIIIGDQGTGKSTVVKLLSAIKEVIDSSEIELNVNEKAANEEQINNYLNDGFTKNLEIYGILNYLNSDTYIEYSDLNASLKYEKKKIVVIGMQKKVRNKNSHVIEYIPAYREAAVLLKDSLNAMAAVGASLPRLFYIFGQKVVNAKLAKGLYDYSDVLGAKYKYIDGKDIIVMKNGTEILISEASSAINSGIPLLMVFDNAVESNYPTGSRVSHHVNCPYIIIEEPELNCFPTTQKKMMEHFISKMKYETQAGFDYYCKLLITTHSPYILTSLNNLMYAYEVGEKKPEAVDEIIDRNYWINPEDVSAYRLMADGTCKKIISKSEDGTLIEADEIDGVSSELNKEFDELIRLEIANTENDEIR